MKYQIVYFVNIQHNLVLKQHFRCRLKSKTAGFYRERKVMKRPTYNSF